MFSTFPSRTLIAATGVALLAAGHPALAAESVADFYKGKQMRLIISTSPGGGYDIYSRFAASHMVKFIPGHPSVVAQNMPGAGHARAGQYMALAAPRDGSVIGTIANSMPFAQLVWPERFKFDTGSFIWIGNVNEGNNVLMLWHTTGVKTWKDLRKKEIIVGATGVRSTSGLYPRALNNILGTKLKLIVGFKGGSQMNLAMERGEIDGRGSNAWASIKGLTPQYLKENKLSLPIQMGLKRDPQLKDVPLIWELGRNEAEKKVLKLLSASSSIGRPILTTPGVPADRVAALRAAFDAAVASKAFVEEAKKRKLDINPTRGVDIQALVSEILSSPKDIQKLARAAVTKGAVFNCKALVKDAKLCAAAKKKKKKKSDDKDKNT
jgi:tripartite-type tricarboxylate transporter receptor subunit TctC